MCLKLLIMLPQNLLAHSLSLPLNTSLQLNTLIHLINLPWHCLQSTRSHTSSYCICTSSNGLNMQSHLRRSLDSERSSWCSLSNISTSTRAVAIIYLGIALVSSQSDLSSCPLAALSSCFSASLAVSLSRLSVVSLFVSASHQLCFAYLHVPHELSDGSWLRDWSTWTVSRWYNHQLVPRKMDLYWLLIN